MVTDSRIEPVADQLVRNGVGVLPMTSCQRIVLDRLIARSRQFFCRPALVKASFASADLNHGYRSCGYEYSRSPERPDLDESFSLWSDHTESVPGSAAIPHLLAQIVRWRDVVAVTVDGLLESLAQRYGGSPPAFRAASSVQINHYDVDPEGRTVLQDRHEDGHVVTVLHATAPGLEIFPRSAPGGRTVDFDGPAVGELLVMPGSTLTELTAGEIPPLEHRVVDSGHRGRVSVMYFVNPELTAPVYPWPAPSSSGAARDLRERIRGAPSSFGLPDTPVLPVPPDGPRGGHTRH